jgi:hypothetical protein
MGSLEPGRTIKYMTDAHGQVSSLKEYKEMVIYSQFRPTLEYMLYNCVRVYRLYKHLKHSRLQ